MPVNVNDDLESDVFEPKYSTSHEKLFLDGLGSHHSPTAKDNLDKLSPTARQAVSDRLRAEKNSDAGRKMPKEMNKSDLLVSYILSASRRRQWGAIDGAKAVTYAKQLLERRRRIDGALREPRNVMDER